MRRGKVQWQTNKAQSSGSDTTTTRRTANPPTPHGTGPSTRLRTGRLSPCGDGRLRGVPRNGKGAAAGRDQAVRGLRRLGDACKAAGGFDPFGGLRAGGSDKLTAGGFDPFGGLRAGGFGGFDPFGRLRAGRLTAGKLTAVGFSAGGPDAANLAAAGGAAFLWLPRRRGGGRQDGGDGRGAGSRTLGNHHHVRCAGRDVECDGDVRAGRAGGLRSEEGGAWEREGAKREDVRGDMKREDGNT